MRAVALDSSVIIYYVEGPLSLRRRVAERPRFALDFSDGRLSEDCATWLHAMVGAVEDHVR